VARGRVRRKKRQHSKNVLSPNIFDSSREVKVGSSRRNGERLVFCVILHDGKNRRRCVQVLLRNIGQTIRHFSRICSQNPECWQNPLADSFPFSLFPPVPVSLSCRLLLPIVPSPSSYCVVSLSCPWSFCRFCRGAGSRLHLGVWGVRARGMPQWRYGRQLCF